MTIPQVNPSPQQKPPPPPPPLPSSPQQLPPPPTPNPHQDSCAKEAPSTPPSVSWLSKCTVYTHDHTPRLYMFSMSTFTILLTIPYTVTGLGYGVLVPAKGAANVFPYCLGKPTFNYKATANLSYNYFEMAARALLIGIATLLKTVIDPKDSEQFLAKYGPDSVGLEKMEKAPPKPSLNHLEAIRKGVKLNKVGLRKERKFAAHQNSAELGPSDSNTEKHLNSNAAPHPNSKPDPTLAPNLDPKADLKSEPKADSKQDTKPDPKPAAPKPDPKADLKPEPKANSKQDTKPDPKPALPKANPKVDPNAPPEPEVNPKHDQKEEGAKSGKEIVMPKKDPVLVFPTMNADMEAKLKKRRAQVDKFIVQ